MREEPQKYSFSKYLLGQRNLIYLDRRVFAGSWTGKEFAGIPLLALKEEHGCVRCLHSAQVHHLISVGGKNNVKFMFSAATTCYCSLVMFYRWFMPLKTLVLCAIKLKQPLSCLPHDSRVLPCGQIPEGCLLVMIKYLEQCAQLCWKPFESWA
jgi:hypothetical protein